MKNINIAGLIVLVAIIMGVMFAGCVEDLFPEQITIEEAQENASFDILEPTYLPIGYEFENVYMAEMKHNDTMIMLTYTNDKDYFELVEDIGLGIGRNLLESAENA